MADLLKDNIKSHLAQLISKAEGETNMDTFTKMKEILNRIFGEANNQIIKPSLENIEKYINECTSSMKRSILSLSLGDTVDYLRNTGNLDYNICVRFPETKIKNSKGAQQTIKDLYVKIPVKPKGTLTGLMRGVVASYTASQYMVGYAHSHLRRFSPNEGPIINDFCLGQGEIRMVLSVLANKFDEINFQLLCFHLKNYVAWESLEGNPFICMNEVISKEGRPLQKRLSSAATTIIADELVKKLFKESQIDFVYPLIKCTTTKIGITVLPTDELEVLLAKMMTEADHPLKVKTYQSVDNVVAYKSNSGEYFGVEATTTYRITLPDRPAIHFKGEEIKFKIADTDQQTKKTLYANPVITRSFCEQLSRKFTNTTLALERSNWFKDTSDNINKTANADSMAVQESTQ